MLFEGNAQSLRIVSRLQFLNDQYGMNFTYGTLGAIIKYPWGSDSYLADKGKFGYFQSEKSLIELIYKHTGTGKDGFKNPLAYLLEAADDIAYLLADIEDGVKKGKICWREEYARIKTAHLRINMDDIFKELDMSFPELSPEKDYIAVQKFRIKIQGLLIQEAIEIFITHYDEIMENRFESDLVEGGKFVGVVEKLKEITTRCCFQSDEVLRLELTGEQAINGLLDRFVPAALNVKEESDFRTREGKLFHLLSKNFRYVFKLDDEGNPTRKYESFDVYDKLLLVTDHISGMTDSFAIKQYQQLFGVRMP